MRSPAIWKKVTTTQFGLRRVCFATPTPDKYRRCYSKKVGVTVGELETELRKEAKETEDLKNTASPRTASSVTSNISYKSFFDDFSRSVSTQGKLTSVGEQKTFTKVFDYLMKNTGSVGVTETLQEFVGIDSAMLPKKTEDGPQFSFRLNSASAQVLRTFQDQIQRNKQLLEKMSLVLQYINSEIRTSEQMVEFIKNNLVEEFAVQYEKQVREQTPPLEYEELLDKIESQATENPAKPYMCTKTLPVLLKFCLNSLTFDFDSLDETLLVLNYVRQHRLIYVYEFGLNIDVYNSVLDQIWRKTQNLQLVVRLLDEIKINAIQPDLLTYKTAAEIYLHCMDVRDQSKAEHYLLWGNSSDIHKVKSFVDSIKLSV